MNSAHDTDEAPAIGDGEVTFALQVARIVARVIDATLVVSVAVVTLILAYGFSSQDLPGSNDERGLALLYLGWWLAAVVVGWAYEAVLVGWKGKTLGKWAAGVEVASAGVTDAPGAVLSMRRSARQLLLWIVVPLGLFSVWRLLLLERGQAWYDRSCGTAVRWAVSAGSRRRRLWSWPEARLGKWGERYAALVLSAGLAAGFCTVAWPPRMQEAAAVSAIELLVTANVVGLGVFVATSGLFVRYNRSIEGQGATRSSLGGSLLALGATSLSGILAGAGYVATQSSPTSDITTLRLAFRSVIFAVLVAGVVALAAMWVAQIEAETEIQDAAGGSKPAKDAGRGSSTA